jgi:hypothetical protein
MPVLLWQETAHTATTHPIPNTSSATQNLAKRRGSYLVRRNTGYAAEDKRLGSRKMDTQYFTAANRKRIERQAKRKLQPTRATQNHRLPP